MKDLILEQLVIEEAINLKLHAKKSELQKLNIYYLNGDNSKTCIYGQMTNHCESERALTLIKKCAIRVYNIGINDTFNGELNGSPLEINVKANNRLLHYISPIEKFLYKYKPSEYSNSIKINKLVAFLKNETQILKF